MIDAHRTAACIVTVVILTVGLSIATVGEAAPIRQGTNAEATCETVSVGQYYCKIDGKCYYCDTKTNPDPNKNCRSTKCEAAMVNPGLKGAVRPQFGARPPIMRRGVEPGPPVSGEQTGDAPSSGAK